MCATHAFFISISLFIWPFVAHCPSLNAVFSTLSSPLSLPNKSFFSVHSSTFYANHQRQQQQNTQIRNNEIKAENRWFCHTSILFSQRWNYQFIYIALYVVISTRMHWNYIHFHYSKFYCCCWMAAFFWCATVIVRVEESER